MLYVSTEVVASPVSRNAQNRNNYLSIQIERPSKGGEG